MKKVAFYSYLGSHIPNLAALAHFKPPDISIEWIVQYPQGIYKPYIDSIISLEQLGYRIQYPSKDLKLKHYFTKQRLIKNYYYPNLREKNSLNKVPVKLTIDNWWDELLSCKPNAIILSTIMLLGNNSVKHLSDISKKIPVFLHDYGQSMKEISIFKLYKERFQFLAGIFLPGKAYLKQMLTRKIKIPYWITGGSKTDFHFLPSLFHRPTNKPFLVYCNSVSHINLYHPQASQPEKWIPILNAICKKMGLDLIVKLHPLTYNRFCQSSWASQVYFSVYTNSLFKQSQGIISDPSTVLLDSLIVQKPLFILKNEVDLPTNLQKLLPYVPRLSINRNIEKVIADHLKHQKKTLFPKNIVSHWWCKLDGHASKRIWRIIKKYL